MLVCFILPIVFTRKDEAKQISNTNAENILEANKTENTSKTNQEEQNYDYKQYNTVKLFHSKTNNVEELPLDKYLLRSCLCRNASFF